MKLKLDLNTKIQQNKKILTSDVDGEKVMMSIMKGEYYGLGKTGTFIWDLLEEPIKINDIINRITERFNVNKEKCYNDIIPFIKDLIEKELVVVTY